MDEYTATEEAYKHGYDDGYKKGWKNGRKAVVKGDAEWIPITSMFGTFNWKVKCSKCRCTINREHNYCPNCGRKMRLNNKSR